MAGGEEGRAAGVPLTTAHLKATAASGGGELGARGGGATEHGRGRELGQTKEGDEGMLYIGLD